VTEPSDDLDDVDDELLPDPYIKEPPTSVLEQVFIGLALHFLTWTSVAYAAGYRNLLTMPWTTLEWLELIGLGPEVLTFYTPAVLMTITILYTIGFFDTEVFDQ
jgi:hypothetical protein